MPPPPLPFPLQMMYHITEMPGTSAHLLSYSLEDCEWTELQPNGDPLLHHKPPAQRAHDKLQSASHRSWPVRRR